MGSESSVVERPPAVLLPERPARGLFADPAAITKPDPAKPPLILLAEDERDILQFYVWFLSRKGYEIHPVDDGIAAVEAASDLRPAVAVLNNMMPRMSGIEACARISAMPALDGIPIVVYSACHLKDFRPPALEAGAWACWATPISPQDFELRLAAVLSGGGRDPERFRRRG